MNMASRVNVSACNPVKQMVRMHKGLSPAHDIPSGDLDASNWRHHAAFMAPDVCGGVRKARRDQETGRKRLGLDDSGGDSVTSARASVRRKRKVDFMKQNRIVLGVAALVAAGMLPWPALGQEVGQQTVPGAPQRPPHRARSSAVCSAAGWTRPAAPAPASPPRVLPERGGALQLPCAPA